MTVRVYSSLDTGAPALSGSRVIDRVKQILLACLVNGYGSKPGAGWTVSHEHADGFSLSNGEGIVNLVNLSSNAYTVYIMEAITDGSTALAGGINRRSGPWIDGSTDTRRQVFYSAHLVSGTNPHWAVVADEKSCVLSFGAGTATSDGPANGCVAHVFGNYLNASGLSGFCSLGGAAAAVSANGSLTGWNGMLLRHPLSGLVDQGATPLYSATGAAYQSSTLGSRASLVSDRFTPVRAGILGYGAGVSGSTNSVSAIYCGRLRGVVSDPVLSSVLASQVLPLLGSSNTWQARVTPITLANGQQYLPVYPSNGDTGYFVSLSEADWG